MAGNASTICIAMKDPAIPREPCDSMREVIDLYKRDVDRSLIASRLALTHEQRFIEVMRAQRMVEELRRAGAEARQARS